MNQNKKKQRQKFESIICKFIINLPYEEFFKKNRYCHHLQKAYYCYIDVYQKLTRKQNQKNDTQNYFYYKLNQFLPTKFKFNPKIIFQSKDKDILACGAIIKNIDNNKIFLVRGSDFKYSFPKGKINQDESHLDCAVREVFQQTGLLINNHIMMHKKIKFMSPYSREPIIFFVAENISQYQTVTIDRRQIMDADWVDISYINYHCHDQNFFTSKSRQAWLIYQEKYSQIKMSIQQFINRYKTKKQNKVQENKQILIDPWLNFKLDRVKIQAILDQD